MRIEPLGVGLLGIDPIRERIDPIGAGRCGSTRYERGLAWIDPLLAGWSCGSTRYGSTRYERIDPIRAESTRYERRDKRGSSR